MVTHPGPASTILSQAIRDAIVEHARRDYPNEACGVILGSAFAADGGQPLRFVPTRNEAASPSRFAIDANEMYRLTDEAEKNGQEIWAIVHSHTHSAAKPSPTDIRLAAWWPGTLYVLVSLDDAHADPVLGEPGIRAWQIVAGEVFEVALSA